MYSSSWNTETVQEEQARKDAKLAALLEEQLRAQQQLQENNAAGRIQRVLRAFVARAGASKGGHKGTKGGGKKGKKGKK